MFKSACNSKIRLKKMNETDAKEKERLLHNALIYMKIYDSLIERAIPRGLKKVKKDYSMEIHHIVPKCLGGTNDKFNLVLLTNREHIIAHMLLQRMYPECLGLANAVNICFGQGTVGISSRTIGIFREEYNRLLSISRLGMRFSEKTKQKIRESRIGSKISDQAKEKISGKNNLKSKTIIDNRVTPPAIFETMKSFLAFNKISEVGLKKLLNDPNSGVIEIPGKLKGKNGYKVLAPDGKIYNSLRKVAKAYNRDRSTIQNYIENYPEKGFSYVDSDFN